jgi:hypothetical protein
MRKLNSKEEYAFFTSHDVSPRFVSEREEQKILETVTSQANLEQNSNEISEYQSVNARE